METKKENREISEKRKNSLANLKTDAGPGRPPGQRNYSTIYRAALIKLASINGKTPEELEEEIDQKAISLARKGDYRFYKDIKDRLHGFPKQSVDLKGEVIVNDGLSKEEKEKLLKLLKND